MPCLLGLSFGFLTKSSRQSVLLSKTENPIHKGSKANISDSDKYRSIAISSLLGKILDHIIIERQSKSLTTSKYQFGFKANSLTVLCSTMVNETVRYYMYTKNCGKSVYVLLLDASKAFDKVTFNVLFNKLRDYSMCPPHYQVITFYVQ